VRKNAREIDWADPKLKWTETWVWWGGTLAVSGIADWEEDKRGFERREEEGEKEKKKEKERGGVEV